MRLPVINPASIRVMPAAAANADITRLTIGTLEGRPVVRLTERGRTQLLFADTGDAVPAVDANQAVRIARAFEGGINNLHYNSRLIDADQWSVRRGAAACRCIALPLTTLRARCCTSPRLAATLC